jgi:hypothetical protein
MMLHQKTENAADQIFAFFPDEKKVSVKYIREYVLSIDATIPIYCLIASTFFVFRLAGLRLA